METLTISVSTQLKKDIQECLVDFNENLEDFMQNAIEYYIRRKGLEAGFAEVDEMHRTGNYGKGYTDIDLLMRELAE